MNDIDDLLTEAGSRFRDRVSTPAMVRMPQRSGRLAGRAVPGLVAVATLLLALGGLLWGGRLDLGRTCEPDRQCRSGSVAGVPLGTPDPMMPPSHSAIPSITEPVRTTAQPALPGRRVTTEWRLLAVSDQGRRLYLTWLVGGGCDQLDHLQVDQSTDRVRIAPIVADNNRPGLVCAADRVAGRGYVDLSSPLDARTLYHAPVDAGFTF